MEGGIAEVHFGEGITNCSFTQGCTVKVNASFAMKGLPQQLQTQNGVQASSS